MVGSERRTDHTSRDRIGEIETRVDDGLAELEEGRKRNRSAIKWLTGGFVILALGVTTALGLYGLLNGETNDLAQENQDVIEAVQTSREDATRSNCEQQNSRHDDTIKNLDAGLAAVPPDQRQQAAQTRAFTITLIDALVPKQDCDERVRALTRLDKPKTKDAK